MWGFKNCVKCGTWGGGRCGRGTSQANLQYYNICESSFHWFLVQVAKPRNGDSRVVGTAVQAAHHPTSGWWRSPLFEDRTERGQHLQGRRDGGLAQPTVGRSPANTEQNKRPRPAATRRLSGCPQARARTHVSGPLLRMSGKGAERRLMGWAEVPARLRSSSAVGGYTGAAVRHFRRGRTEVGEGGVPAVAPLFVLEAQLMAAGRPRGRLCREEVRRHCRLSCGLHPGKLPVGGRRNGRLRERAAGSPGHSSGIPGLISPRRVLPGRESGETPGPEDVPGSRLRRRPGTGRSPRAPGLMGARRFPPPRTPWALLVQTRRLFRFLWSRPALPVPPPKPPSLGSESAWLPLGSRFSSSSREPVKAMSLFYIILHCRRIWFVGCSLFLIISSFFVTLPTLNSALGCCCFRGIEVRAFWRVWISVSECFPRCRVCHHAGRNLVSTPNTITFNESGDT